MGSEALPCVYGCASAFIQNNQFRKGSGYEDRAIMKTTDVGIYSVLDGHKGDVCVEFVAEHLYSTLEAQENLKTDPAKALSNTFAKIDQDYVKKVFDMGRVTQTVNGTEMDITRTVRECGCAGAVVLVTPPPPTAATTTSCPAETTSASEAPPSASGGDAGTLVKGVLTVAWAGDCRAVLSRSGHAVQLTEDHSIRKNTSEVERLQNMGASIARRRLYGTLMVTRSFGDPNFKFNREERERLMNGEHELRPEAYIKDPFTSGSPLTAVPETHVEHIMDSDDFVVIASDGLYDQIDNQEIVTFLSQSLDVGRQHLASLPKEKQTSEATQEALNHVCRSLIRHVESVTEADEEEHDDITVVLVLLKPLLSSSPSVPE
eukprot:Rmarinus@m.27626